MVSTFLLVAFIWVVVSRRRRHRRGLDHWRGGAQQHLEDVEHQVGRHLENVERQVGKHLEKVDVGGWLETYRGGARIAQKRQQMVQRDVPSARVAPQPEPESPMDALQRRYVADEITVEEYERQLDELLKKK